MAENVAGAGILKAGETSQDQVNRRKFKNFFVKSRYKVRFVPYFAIGGMVSIAAVGYLIHQRLLAIDELLNNPEAMGISGHIPVYDAFTDITTIALAGFSFMIVYSCLIAVMCSHRVSGPMTAIVACIDEMKRGNFAFARNLRKHDELKPIHEALRELGRVLQEKENAK